MSEEKLLGNIPAIKQYFESGEHGRKVELDELKTLSSGQRMELADMCREAIGKGWD